MADNTVVHIGENSPEQVAYKLMQDIAKVEGRDMYSHGDRPADRQWILSTYFQCLKAAKGYDPLRS